MKSKILTCITAMTLLAALAFPVLAAQHNRHNTNGKFITFDDPNEGTGAGQGIIPYGINPLGAIIGWYVDGNSVNHGFLRAPDGTITSFDAPDAGTGAGQGTIAYGMNTWGVIVGISTDNDGVVHGFVRNLWGKITIFDYSGAGTSSGQGTWLANINDEGEITGGYIDETNAIYELLLLPNGKQITFEAPGAGTGYFQGTDSPTLLCPEPGWGDDRMVHRRKLLLSRVDALPERRGHKFRWS